MTSNDAPASGGRPARRRALGRGPETAPPGAGPSEPPAPDGPAGPGTPDGTGAPDPGTPSPAAVPGTPDGTIAAPRGVSARQAGGGPALDAPVEAGESFEGPGEPAPADETSTTPQGPCAGDGEPGPAAGPVGGAVVEQAAAGGTAGVLTGPGALEAGPGAVAVGSVPEGTRVPAGADGAGAEEGGGRFKVRLANFEGPFDLLLQLIGKHKLDVTEVALSKVTDEFMAYIRAMGSDWDLDETTEFLVVAATLLDLKAARLLPTAEVEDEADLALLEARDLLFARLLQYRAYKRIADIFDRRLDEEARRHPRTVGLEPHHAELLPEVVISIGAEGFARLAVKAMQPRPKPQVYVDHIHAPLVSVQEQAGIVVARLKELGEASFRSLVEDTDDTLTVVARFLALLELYREKAVALDQETALGELTVRWTGGDGDAEPTVTDEFDRPPEQPQEERKP
ncbi:segregation/condensation protein A [Streptomyces sp. NPDC088106]|uniref:segregation and condensation protein A n=1 Tax=Streptomyces sp. NPDC088106 TaxID=3154867 RepID=UPI00344367B3